MKRILGLMLVMLSFCGAVRAQPRVESCSPTSGLCWPRLKRGAKGEAVRTLQTLLKDQGFRVALDGQLGFATESAVRSFQKRHHLKVDGIVGYQTWSEVVPCLERGSKGAPVRQLQTLLLSFRKNQKLLKVDGVYGSQTQEAVRKINVEMSFDPIKGSGKADEAVWCALLGGHYDGE